MPAPLIASAVPDGPVSKRQKLTESEIVPQRPRAQRSRIFAPFRTVGLVSPTSVPFSVLPLGKTTFQVITSVGKSLQTYDLRRGLNLVFLTRPETPENITATAVWKDRVFAAWGADAADSAHGVWVFKRGKKVDELEQPAENDEPIGRILIFGAWIVGCCSTKIEVWKSSSYEHYTTLRSPFSSKQGVGNHFTHNICNIPTYLNKILVGKQDGSVEIWNINTAKLVYTIFPPASDYGAVTALQATPALSLVVIAFASGPVVIHDVRVDRKILSLNSASGPKTPVTSISFRTDGLGAGTDGRKEGVMATASQGSGDITFWDLNGGGRKMGVLRGAHNPPFPGQNGVAGGISKIEFPPGQAVILSSGLDNSIKSWIFDETPFSPIPRILHLRSGHAAPVTCLQFLPSDADGVDAGGKWLMSASNDRSFWGWSLRRDGQSTELSQGNIRKKAKKLGILSNGLASLDSNMGIEELKAPPITCMACSLNRDGGIGAIPGAQAVWGHARHSKKTTTSGEGAMTGWESVVTGHKGDKLARTWFWGRKRAGRWALETGDGTEVTSVAVSPCGTFALVGSAGGGIDMYNLQSGIHRQRYPPRLSQEQALKLRLRQIHAAKSSAVDLMPKKYARGEGKHTRAVTGLAVDSLNRRVISSGKDGKVKFWDFSTGLLIHEIDWSSATSIEGLRYHRPSDLIALNCSDNVIRVVDIETKKLIRELPGCEGDINDFCFSNDGRWIIAAAKDLVIRVWDLPTGHLIDAIKLRNQCNALAFSNTGEHLATALDNTVGVHIWTNRTLFTHVPTRHISNKDIAEIEAPTASGEGGQAVVVSALEQETEEEADDLHIGASTSLDQLSDGLLTLSLVPRARWQTLLHLDLIRERNKPKEPPKPPEKAPFFLPSLQQNGNSALKPATVAGTDSSALVPSNPSRVLRLSQATASSDFTTILHTAITSSDFPPFIDHLKLLPPATADLEIRSLNPRQPYTELEGFVRALTDRLRARRDYELVQAWMAVFLRVHGDVVVQDERLVAVLREWRGAQEKEAGRLRELVGFCSGVVGFLRSPRA